MCVLNVSMSFCVGSLSMGLYVLVSLRSESILSVYSILSMITVLLPLSARVINMSLWVFRKSLLFFRSVRKEGESVVGLGLGRCM